MPICRAGREAEVSKEIQELDGNQEVGMTTSGRIRWRSSTASTTWNCIAGEDAMKLQPLAGDHRFPNGHDLLRRARLVRRGTGKIDRARGGCAGD